MEVLCTGRWLGRRLSECCGGGRADGGEGYCAWRVPEDALGSGFKRMVSAGQSGTRGEPSPRLAKVHDLSYVKSNLEMSELFATNQLPNLSVLLPLSRVSKVRCLPQDLFLPHLHGRSKTLLQDE